MSFWPEGRHSVDELDAVTVTEGRLMNTTRVTRNRDEAGAVVAAATAGNESAFTSLTERYRRELQVHCYRMLGSLEDSEDVVQETFLRAWRKRGSYRGRSTFRAWLYGIATNACLDALQRRPRHLQTAQGPEVGWIQPYPDRLLEGVATTDAEPDEAVVSKETIELAFLAAIQHLPPRQRAVLIVRDVLGWSAKDSAALLDASVASVNSALQRARATLKKHLPERRLEWAPGLDPSEEERALLQRYVEASERADAEALVELMREDARFAMPPEPDVYVGREAIVGGWIEGGLGTEHFRDFRSLFTRANMQPAVAFYLRRPGESEYAAFALDVLRIEDGAIGEIIAFPSDLFPAFDLPSKL
jgi:RNA polymerase sigma-70 factor (ECF subfamily)